MTRQSDLDINRHIRRVLVRHWIDLGRLSIRTYNGSAIIRGRLERIPGNEEGLTSAIVEGMFREMKRAAGIRRVKAEFENWTDRDGGWKPVQPDSAPDSQRRTAPIPRQTYEIRGDPRDG
ncbi:MAG: hypothetical protein R6V03_03985 [Kiritimatiellia bacterium]